MKQQLKLAALGSLLWLAGVQAEPVMTVIAMRHAQPEQALPLIARLLKADETATGFRGQLIIHASPDSLLKVRRLLEDIDRAPRNLWVQVSDRLAHNASGTAVEAGSRLGDERGRVAVGDTPGRSDHLTLRAGAGQSRRDEQLSQQIRAVEGYPAFIARAQTVPVARVRGPGGTQVITQTAEQGFFVTARLQGTQVFIDLSASHDRLEAARLESRRTVTTVSGRLGEWIAVSGLDDSHTENRQSLTGTRSHHGDSSGTLWLRVQLAD